MFKLLNRHKKGVSPVIAVVLLIALTVAAAAVIWALTSGILDDASSETVRVESITAASIGGTGSDTITLSFIMNADASGTIVGGSVSNTTGPLTSATASVTASSPFAFIKGDNAVTITFTLPALSSWTSGEYTFNINWQFGSGGSPEISTISTSVS